MTAAAELSRIVPSPNPERETLWRFEALLLEAAPEPLLFPFPFPFPFAFPNQFSIFFFFLVRDQVLRKNRRLKNGPGEPYIT